jgi:tRNA splicing ligase
MDLSFQLDLMGIIFKANDVDEFKKQYQFLKDNYKSEEEVKRIDDFIENLIHSSVEESERSMEEIRLRCHLILNKDIIPVSYIAKNYFNKSKDWLYQRINKNNVNGKPANFTDSEIRTFNHALQDIGKRIGSIA